MINQFLQITVCDYVQYKWSLTDLDRASQFTIVKKKSTTKSTK